VESIEAVDDAGQHRHQLAPLFLQIALEQDAHLGRQLEQPPVEQVRGLWRDGEDLLEAGLHQHDVSGCHAATFSFLPKEAEVRAEMASTFRCFSYRNDRISCRQWL